MSNKGGVVWNWDPFPKTRKARSRPTQQSVETYQLLATRTTTSSERPNAGNGNGVNTTSDVFEEFKTIADFHRRRRSSKPKAFDWSFKNIELSISSDDSNDSNELLENKQIMTSTPQMAVKVDKRVLSVTANSGQSSAKRVANRALIPLPNNILKQMTPKGKALGSAVPSIVKSSLNRKTPSMAMTSFARKSFIPEQMERTVLDCSPYASPFTPKTIIKKKRQSRNNRTLNTYNNTTLFGNDTTIHRSFKSTTTQTNESLKQMNDLCDQTFDVTNSNKTNDAINDRIIEHNSPETAQHLIEHNSPETAQEVEDIDNNEVIETIDINVSQNKETIGENVKSHDECVDNGFEAEEQTQQTDINNTTFSVQKSVVEEEENEVNDQNSEQELEEKESEKSVKETNDVISEKNTEDDEQQSAVEEELEESEDDNQNEDKTESGAEEDVYESEVEELNDNFEEIDTEEEVESEDEEQTNAVINESVAKEENEDMINRVEEEVQQNISEDEFSEVLEQNINKSIERLNQEINKSLSKSENSNHFCAEDLDNSDVEEDIEHNQDFDKSTHSCNQQMEDIDEENSVQNIETFDTREVLNERPSPHSSESQGLRRSKRNRLPILEYWRGQRPVYKRDSSGITEKIVAIADGSQEIRKIRKKRVPKRKAESEYNRNEAINIFDLSLHKKVKTSNENKGSLNVKSLDDFVWKESSQSTGVDITIINKNKAKGDALGMLRFRGMAQKKKSKTGDYATHLSVTYGALSLEIEDNPPLVIRTGDYFKIDTNCNYSLNNLRNDTAFLSFTVLKE